MFRVSGISVLGYKVEGFETMSLEFRGKILDLRFRAFVSLK